MNLQLLVFTTNGQGLTLMSLVCKYSSQSLFSLFDFIAKKQKSAFLAEWQLSNCLVFIIEKPILSSKLHMFNCFINTHTQIHI